MPKKEISMTKKAKVEILFTWKQLHGANWVEGTYGEYKYQAKIFNEPSDYGIDFGRVSKLCITTLGGTWADVVVNYDRGWDKGKGKKKLYRGVVGRLEFVAQGLVY